MPYSIYIYMYVMYMYISYSHISLSRIEKESGIKTGNAEQTTDALEKACADKRNAVSIAVGHSMVTSSR